MALPSVTIRTKIAVMIGTFSFLFLVYGIYSFKTMEKVNINGELYSEIIKGKDLLADILPPPEYLIESYLTCNRLAFETDKQAQSDLIDKLASLKKDYVDRQKYWQENLEDSPIKELIMKKSSEPAFRFFDASEKYVALISSDNKKEALDLLNGDLTKLYEEHRAQIDILVEKSGAWASDNEKVAADLISSSKIRIIAIAIIAVLLNLGIGLLTGQSIIMPIKNAINYAAEIAKGKLD